MGFTLGFVLLFGFTWFWVRLTLLRVGLTTGLVVRVLRVPVDVFATAFA